MILPRPARIMCGNTDWQRRNGPNRFAEKVFAHSLPSTSQTRPIGPYVPAALTRISMRPNNSMDFFVKDTTSGGTVTSVTTKRAVPPSELTASATASSSGAVRADNINFAPSAANRNAMASPMPLPAPTIRATLSCSRSRLPALLC